MKSGFPRFSVIFALFALSLAPVEDAGAVAFIPSDVSSLTNSSVEALLKTVGVGADHRAYMPASDLGIALGFDVGIDFTAIKPPQEFIDAFALVTGQSIPTYIPLPRLNIHKGLPFGIDLGFSYLGYTDPGFSVKMVGGEVKWAFIRGKALPAVAARVSGNYSSLGFLNSRSYKFDITASKSLVVAEPYVGTGLQIWSGELSYPATVGSLPVDVSGKASGTNPHFYAGLMMKLIAFRVSAEYDYSTTGVSTVGGKVSLGF